MKALRLFAGEGLRGIVRGDQGLCALRLLTLDQLGRASTLICALELERQRQPEKLGSWPFEIGLWVGQAGTPNRMGGKGNSSEAFLSRFNSRTGRGFFA